MRFHVQYVYYVKSYNRNNIHTQKMARTRPFASAEWTNSIRGRDSI